MRLGVNIDHVATIRQARRALEPEPAAAALIAELAGAESITVHLRSDRRHIQDRDVEVLRRTIGRRGVHKHVDAAPVRAVAFGLVVAVQQMQIVTPLLAPGGEQRLDGGWPGK